MNRTACRPSFVAVVAFGALLLVAGCERGVTETARLANCMRDAQANVDAAQQRDVDAMVRYLHPSALTSGLGAEKMKQGVRKMFAQMELDGTSIESVKLTPPTQTFVGGKKRFAIVDESVVLRVKETLSVSAESYLLGVSEDDGKTWRFVDGNGLKKLDVTKILPEYPLAQNPLPVKPSPSISLADVRKLPR